MSKTIKIKLINLNKTVLQSYFLFLFPSREIGGRRERRGNISLIICYVDDKRIKFLTNWILNNDRQSFNSPLMKKIL